jgi:DNA-binding transcriptional LysR family regulator
MSDPDLNLLRLFDILYEERSVTRSAARLNLTQSAVSHALGRLRGTFDDPLFTRGPGGLLPTARAIGLAPRIHDILVSIRDTFAAPTFDPATSQRRFTIAGGQYFSRLVFPRLVAFARSTAPGVSIALVNIDQALPDDLDEGVIDLAFGGFEDVPARLVSAPLFREEMVWVAARDHPRGDALQSAAGLFAEKRIDIFVEQAPRPLRADRPRDLLVRRLRGEELLLVPPVASRESYGAQVYDTDTALAIVAATDLVAVVARKMVEASAHLPALQIFPSPDAVLPVELTMLWHRRFSDDPGGAWLREVVGATCRAIGGAASAADEQLAD